MTELETIKEKVDFFMHEKVEVHVKLKNKTFINGFIKKQLKDGVYWFKDRKLDGVYLFLKDIYDVGSLQNEELKKKSL